MTHWQVAEADGLVGGGCRCLLSRELAGFGLTPGYTVVPGLALPKDENEEDDAGIGGGEDATTLVSQRKSTCTRLDNICVVSARGIYICKADTRGELSSKAAETLWNLSLTVASMPLFASFVVGLVLATPS
jgi:hypothetical protein